MASNHPSILRIPTIEEKSKIVEAFQNDLNSFVVKDHRTQELKGAICCVCDSIQKKENDMEWSSIKDFSSLCEQNNLHHDYVESSYEKKEVLKHYRLPRLELSAYVLSPSSIISQDEILCCRSCLKSLTDNADKQKRSRKPPKDALANYNVTGVPPEELTCLNEIELSLVSRVRIYSQTYVLFGGCHKMMKGWHTLYRNRNIANVISLDQLKVNGMKGTIFVVLCGPFTAEQKALAYKRTVVDVNKVKRAMKWLIKNNIWHKDEVIPPDCDYPQPIFVTAPDEHGVAHSVVESDGDDSIIENQLNRTVVFPDPDAPTPDSSVFESQESFRKYILEKEDGNWMHLLMSRPTADRVADYEDQTIAEAFPLQFPYGYTGLPGDPAVEKALKMPRQQQHVSRKRHDVIKKFLKRGDPNFQTPLFCLVLNSIIMRESIFKSTTIHCNLRKSNMEKLGERFGKMSKTEFESEIEHSNMDNSKQYSNSTEAQFLRSVKAACKYLPHTNEHAADARKKYYAYLMKFGFPAIFLTITPDDSRSFRISVYANTKKEKDYDNLYKFDTMTDNQLLDEFNYRQRTRSKYPGLCSEDYQRIMNLVIKHIFGWNEENGRATETGGLYGDTIAWLIATEEQTRKSLHGHCLIFLRDWNRVLKVLQRRQGEMHSKTGLSYEKGLKISKDLVASASSSQMFADFKYPSGILSKKYSVFQHECVKKTRKRKARRMEMTPVDIQCLRDMRHKKRCHEHNGTLGSCSISGCNHSFTVHNLITSALNHGFGKRRRICFTDNNNYGLQYAMYEMQKPGNPINMVTEERNEVASSLFQEKSAWRYFACNALVNSHYVNHTHRCFKKTLECYADLPDCARDETTISYCDKSDVWHDWEGKREVRTMYKFLLQRNAEDAFVNTHSPELTLLLGCNTNVVVGFNGQSVLYVTKYCGKGTQEEEKMAFETVSSVICRSLENPTEEQLQMPESQRGFRLMLMAVYAHTRSHIVAAPMAHYLVEFESRFRYSHETVYSSCYGLERYLLDEAMIMTLRNVGNSLVPTHTAFNYLYRPTETKHLCLYDFERYYEVFGKKIATNKGYSESQQKKLDTDHPQSKTSVVCQRKNEAVPVFAWMWLGKTSDFKTPITEAINTNNSDHEIKEKYARRFMILFLPFNSKNSDLTTNGTYQERFQDALRNKEFPDIAFEVADNVMNIGNSMNSQFPEDGLKQATQGFEVDDIGNDENNGTVDLDALCQNIGSVLAAGASVPEFDEEVKDLNPRIALDEEDKRNLFPERGTNSEKIFGNVIGNVIQVSTQLEKKKNNDKDNSRRERFQTSTSELNTLFSSTFLKTPAEMEQEQKDQEEKEEEEEKNDEEGDRDDANEAGKTKPCMAIANGSWQSVILWGKLKGLDVEQQVAFEILASTYVLTFVHDAAVEGDPSMDLNYEGNIKCLQRLARQDSSEDNGNKPLVLFVTGPAGAGKSMLFTTLEQYCRSFSKLLGHHFTTDTIKVSAFTGSAAADIKGDTTARTFHLAQKKTHLCEEEIQQFADTRLCIADEASFGCYNRDFKTLSHRMKEFTRCNQHLYGNVAFCFLGDLRQLTPVKGTTVYDVPNGLYWEQAITHLVVLIGSHRFKDCAIMRDILGELRNGRLSDEHRKILNSRVIGKDGLAAPNIRHTPFATFSNAKRCGINSAIFKTYLEEVHSKCTINTIPATAVVIKSSPTWAGSKRELSFGHRKVYFEECNEATFVNGESKRCDPMLKLFRGCYVMTNENLEVINGIANGTTATFEKVVLKPGKTPTPIQLYGYWINSVDVKDVDFVMLRWHDSLFRGTFKVKPQEKTYKGKLPVTEFGKKTSYDIKLKIMQIPMVINHATTGHKLQGKSLKALVIAQWVSLLNWAYVVLSRVKTLSGLYLTQPIPHDMDFSVPPEYTSMMERLEDRRATQHSVSDLHQAVADNDSN